MNGMPDLSLEEALSIWCQIWWPRNIILNNSNEGVQTQSKIEIVQEQNVIEQHGTKQNRTETTIVNRVSEAQNTIEALQDKCVAHKIISSKHFTVLWHVDYIKLSHVQKNL